MRMLEKLLLHHFQIGSGFIKKQAALYGADLHFFAAIQFTEELPSSGSSLVPQPDHEYLAAWGAATHGGIVEADDQGVWVLDGWFANANGEVSVGHGWNIIRPYSLGVLLLRAFGYCLAVPGSHDNVAQHLQYAAMVLVRREQDQSPGIPEPSPSRWHPDPGLGGGLDRALAGPWLVWPSIYLVSVPRKVSADHAG